MLFCNPVSYMQTVKKAHCVSQIYERTVKKKKNSKEEEEEEEALKKKDQHFQISMLMYTNANIMAFHLEDSWRCLHWF